MWLCLDVIIALWIPQSPGCLGLACASDGRVGLARILIQCHSSGDCAIVRFVHLPVHAWRFTLARFTLGGSRFSALAVVLVVLRGRFRLRHGRHPHALGAAADLPLPS